MSKANREMTDAADGETPETPNIYGHRPNGQFRPKDEGDGRDPRNGRFLKGNKASPGRRPAIVKESILATWEANVTPGEIAGVVRALLDKAQHGSIEAAKVLLSRCLPEETRIAMNLSSEFRAAGRTDDEADNEMLARIQGAINRRKAIAEQRETDTELVVDAENYEVNE